ncbi:hypothetical protein GOQ29_12735 [Clostridium sp. D2Q-14]|uniref:complex I subunit 5 family protein n=1 Tax=Anaeromonas gelatinilytica TaxID=2683194 RepID=UPI00193AF657|nr:proton-conducting transporter membrane subunit [Anaeromonas gelatinilytica]MBS4536486.1 hypothetical protein [Anaeromonas gelatinilytica]
MEFIPIYLIFIPIISALIIYLVHDKRINYLVFFSQSLMTILAIVYFMYFDKLARPQLIKLGGWPRELGISLFIDRLSMAFIFLSIFIWWMVLIYEWHRSKEEFKFLFFLLFLEGVFIAFLQSNDIFNLYVLLEIITILSAILIIYKKDGYSVKSGLFYLLFNSVGVSFYLIGLILLYSLTGTLNMGVIADRIAAFENTELVRLAYVFIFSAVGVKSALFPVYTWLPRAHGAAPASISALLSGLLVKSGLYAFIRMNQMFNITILYDFFFILGFITGLSGVIFALSQKDIKQILAFHTISQIGIILMGLSAMEGELYIGGVLHIFNHAIFKALLFLGAGIIINRYGTRRITEIRGVFKESPVISIFMIVGILAITGAPMFNGFISKSIIKYGLKMELWKVILLQILNLGTATSFIKFSQMFFGTSHVNKIKEKGSTIVLGILAIACVVFGLFIVDILDLIVGIDISFVTIFSFKYLIEYLVTLGIGYIIYKVIIDKDYPVIQKLRHLNVSFQSTNAMLIGFICIMIIWIKLRSG